MKEVRVEINDGMINVWLSGHIDSANAEEVKSELFGKIGDAAGPVTVDASGLEYISSAGLRILLQLRKKHAELHITDVSPEVYEIFDVTGFTQMMDVSRAYKKVSIDGCEVIGKGANGTIYRIDKDNVVKVYNNADALEDIQHEREVARLALILGIPTAISYDIVKVGDSYGSVFELLNARSFSKILETEPERIDWCVSEYVELLHKIHDTEVPEGKLPDMKKTALGWAKFMKDHLPEETGSKLVKLVEDVPYSNHMIHGDYHTKNVELTNDEVLLIDMDTLAVGDPVFEFASIYNALIGFYELNHDGVVEFQGFSYDTSVTFWNKVMAAYAGTDDAAVIESLSDRARIIGYTRLIRRSIRRGGLEDEQRKKEINHWTEELIGLVSRIDCLSYKA
ncbi:MAG: anti-sigma factor antagonist [Mogibacterium sp.]|nr:anti-sigma factor antagonist [Mogibacterium sp.]